MITAQPAHTAHHIGDYWTLHFEEPDSDQGTAAGQHGTQRTNDAHSLQSAATDRVPRIQLADCSASAHTGWCQLCRPASGIEA